MTRTDNLKHAAAKTGKPANFAVFNQANLTYFTNTQAATALLIPENGENILYASSTNYQQVKAEAKNAIVELIRRGESVIEKIGKQCPETKLGVDSVSIEGWRGLANAVGGEMKLEPINQLIRELRAVKDPDEIQLIRKACKIADIGIRVAAEVIRSGVTEKDVAAEVEYAMRKAGSDGVAFDTIVASGYCCAYPHGTLLERTIQEGDFVVVDLGATWRFYRSDITRTFVVGKPDERQTRMFEAVLSAHQKAFKLMAPGVAARKVDKAAWHVIEEAGFGEFFVHNLGHGVGLEVHEAPVLSPESKDILSVGNVVTDEPGIYVPGFCGVRIEDTVLITADGAEKLSSAPYRLK